MGPRSWSALGPRIYAKTEVSCGERPKRVISGFSAVVSGPTWITPSDPDAASIELVTDTGKVWSSASLG